MFLILYATYKFAKSNSFTILRIVVEYLCSKQKGTVYTKTKEQ